MRDAVYDDALSWLNQLRAEYNAPALAELPVGQLANCSTCPVAQALPGGGTVDSDFVWLSEHDRYIETPDQILAFVHRFDDGHYPELIA